MDTYENKLITDVLSAAHLSTMPQKCNPDKVIWIEAIAKFHLSNNSFSYGIVKRNHDLSHRVTYVNGEIASIVKIEEVYPYITLNKEYIQKFPKAAKEKERIEYLRSLNLPYIDSLDLDNMSMDELNKEVVKAAVFQQIKALEE